MQAMARFLISRGISAASLWVMRDNRAARRFYEAIGGRLVAEKSDKRRGVRIAEVAYGWDDLGPLSGDGAARSGGRRATT
jgi:ribosomal protein S18 acetylase RimI-like enzyme